MLILFVISLSTFYIIRASAQDECTDVRGRLMSHGLHYVPGPDTCTLCICDNGQAKECKAVLCSPPQDCRSFRVGNTCCEFICLDDVVKPVEPTDPSIRVAAIGAFAIVVMTLILVVYNIRKQKRRRTPHTDDQRSMTSIGYISGSMAYVGGSCETGFAAWKPPSNYMPRGEAPPPYDEAVAQSRAETMRMSEQALHRSYPATVTSLARDDGLQCAPHPYGNMPRQIAQMPNPQNCYNAPLLQPVHQMDSRDMVHQIPPHMLAPNVGFPSAVGLTGSLGAISGRALSVREPPPDRPHHVPGFYTPNVHTTVHRTIPRISTAVDATLLDTSIAGFSRADRSLQNEIRRSFHKPAESSRLIYDTGRSMPRGLNLTEGLSVEERVVVGGRARAFSDEHAPRAESDPPEPAPSHPPMTSHQPPQPQSTLPLTADKPSCVCSYESPSAPVAEETDDYRSECENCKSASSSRWVLEEGWRGEAGDGTQTLQRRPPPAAPPPATHTLPQPVTKQRTVMGPPSNWENWFNTIPDSDTESEEE